MYAITLSSTNFKHYCSQINSQIPCRCIQWTLIIYIHFLYIDAKFLHVIKNIALIFPGKKKKNEVDVVYNMKVGGLDSLDCSV